MALTTFGVTVTDIENRLHGFDLNDVSDFIQDLINDEAAVINAKISREGLDPSTVAATDWLYNVARQIIILRVVAEVGRDFTHQNPELSTARDQKADKLEEYLHRAPETLIPQWDPDEHRGSFRSKLLTRISRNPGSSWDTIFGD